MKRKIKIYIASPYTNGGKYNEAKVANVQRQIDAFASLADFGFIPYAPLLNHYVNQEHPRDWQFWIDQCEQWVECCDCVLRLSGESKGADVEVEWAKAQGKPVFRTVHEVVDYYNNKSGIMI